MLSEHHLGSTTKPRFIKEGASSLAGFPAGSQEFSKPFFASILCLLDSSPTLNVSFSCTILSRLSWDMMFTDAYGAAPT